MDQTLRRALTPPGRALALLAALLVMGPLVPGLLLVFAPLAQAGVWAAFGSDPQLPQALAATLVSAVLGTGLAVLLAIGAASALYPGPAWHRLRQGLPLLLSLPHAAFAVGLFFLLAPSGWLARALAPLMGWSSPPGWVSVQDPLGLVLALALALKEAVFLLWVLASLLGEQAVARQMLVAQSLGHGRQTVWRQVLWPQLLPRLGWPLVAVWAYSLSVVDMAVVLGPGNPPTLAVLAWHWLTHPDPARQAQGAAASALLLGLLLAGLLLVRASWRALAARRRYPGGVRVPSRRLPAAVVGVPLFGTGAAVLGVLLLWSLAGAWFFPALWPDTLTLAVWLRADPAPLATTLWLGALSSLLCLPVALLWLEWGPRRHDLLLMAPLLLPALPLAAGQYALLLPLQLDSTAAGLLWSHLPWVLPYTVLVLAGPYRAFDPRLLTTARALGHSRLSACWRVKWPLLLRSLLAALAVGFAVSVAQYLPTLFAGGGRFATVTTEAVALSGGGQRGVLAVQALLQVLLPALVFALALGLPRVLARRRLGWR